MGETIPEKAPTTTLADLPSDVLLVIFGSLSTAYDLFKLQRTCRYAILSYTAESFPCFHCQDRRAHFLTICRRLHNIIKQNPSLFHFKTPQKIFGSLRKQMDASLLAQFVDILSTSRTIDIVDEDFFITGIDRRTLDYCCDCDPGPYALWDKGYHPL
jgi:hypothetical protein